MKLIKTSPRTSICDDILSHLSLLDIERNFVFDNEKLIDILVIKYRTVEYC
jgi:hypothetical protein